MSRAAFRILLSFAMVVVAGLMFSGAQPLPGEPKEEPSEPEFSGIMEDIPLEELIQLYSLYENRVLVFDPRLLAGKQITVSAPPDGVGVDMENLVRSGLREHGYLLVRGSPFDRIVPMVELASVATAISLEELAEARPLEPVSVVVHVRNMLASAILNTVSARSSKIGGQVSSVSLPDRHDVNALVVSDFAVNVRSIVQSIRELDAEVKLVSSVVALKHVKCEEIATALENAATAMHSNRNEACAVSFVPARQSVVLTGSAAEVIRLEAVIAALDTEAD